MDLHRLASHLSLESHRLGIAPQDDDAVFLFLGLCAAVQFFCDAPPKACVAVPKQAHLMNVCVA
eukprot:m.160595 g.160595  ORF g.160595 m.160595 type:complete len:64 (+) comp10275_c0_seq12:1626-1817(+)